ncbi:MAG: MmcQ/YjbR family DNA-binding protein [Prevotellaceae bacterium]|jgi:predicted DNA-binding protein (MmcQ/YjbR family)|nr:MmcQ/YjbR family DNA-binding protein [Prevotellaceae bacterium]
MNIEELREVCLSVPGAEECLPFDYDTPVYKVMGKMFAFYGLTPKDGNFFVNLKCAPERSAELRERYRGITKPYHTSDTLKWNSVYLQDDVPDALISELVQHSADEVIKALPKKKKEEWLKYRT